MTEFVKYQYRRKYKDRLVFVSMRNCSLYCRPEWYAGMPKRHGRSSCPLTTVNHIDMYQVPGCASTDRSWGYEVAPNPRQQSPGRTPCHTDLVISITLRKSERLNHLTLFSRRLQLTRTYPVSWSSEPTINNISLRTST